MTTRKEIQKLKKKEDRKKRNTKTKQERREKKEKKNACTLVICQDSRNIPKRGPCLYFKNRQNRQARQKDFRHYNLPENLQELVLPLDQGLKCGEGGVANRDEIS